MYDRSAESLRRMKCIPLHINIQAAFYSGLYVYMRGTYCVRFLLNVLSVLKNKMRSIWYRIIRFRKDTPHGRSVIIGYGEK